MQADSTRSRLEDAAVDCAAVTFPGAIARFSIITRLALSIGKEFRRTVKISTLGADVVVTFGLAAAGDDKAG
jgi:hypothetical protein